MPAAESVRRYVLPLALGAVSVAGFAPLGWFPLVVLTLGGLYALLGRLTDGYRALREAIGSGNRQVLQLAQREWIRYRDAEAAFRSDYSHRHDQPFRTLQKALLTESRLRQLRLYLDDLRDAGVARRGDA